MNAVAVRALVFDVFGTVVDWRGSIIREGEAMSAAKGWRVDWAALADAWRAGYQPAMQRAMQATRAATRPGSSSTSSIATSSTRCWRASAWIELTAAEREHLNLVWHRLEPSARRDRRAGPAEGKGADRDAVERQRLAARRHGAPRAGCRGTACSRRSCSASTSPSPGVYRGAADLLGVAPNELLMVAAHPSDLAAAHAPG